MFSKKATKNDEIFTVDLTVTTYCQIDGEDFCGLPRKRELYRIGVGGILSCLKRFLRILRNMLLNVEKKICFLLPGTVNMSLCGLACY